MKMPQWLERGLAFNALGSIPADADMPDGITEGLLNEGLGVDVKTFMKRDLERAQRPTTGFNIFSGIKSALHEFGVNAPKFFRSID